MSLVKAVKSGIQYLATWGYKEAHSAADTYKRSMSSWRPPLFGPNAANDDFSRHEIIARCHDAYRNQPLAKAAIDRLTTEIIGTGLTMQSHLNHKQLGISQELAEEKQQEIEYKFKLWCDNPIECDIQRQLCFSQMQELSFRTAKNSGDSFASTPFYTNPGGIFGTKVQIIEGDRVSNNRNQRNTSFMIDGIQVDTFGCPVSVFVREVHPGEVHETRKLFTWKELSIFNDLGQRRVMHVYDMLRPDQRRGISKLSIALEGFKQLDRYAQAEIFAAVTAADPALYVTSQFGDTLTDFPQNESIPISNNAENEIITAPGAIVELAPGEDIKSTTPGRPNSQYEPFVGAKLKEFAASISIPVEILLMHFSASFSASRAAFLMFKKVVMKERRDFALRFCQPIFEVWLQECYEFGYIDLPGYEDPFKKRAWCKTMWQGPALGSIKELESVLAAKERIELWLSDEETEAAEIGHDAEMVFNRRKKEIERKRDNNLLNIEVDKRIVKSIEDGEKEEDVEKEMGEEDGNMGD